MPFEVELDVILREGGRRVMDRGMAKALNAVRNHGSIEGAARSLRTTPERLRRRLERMNERAGRALIALEGGSAELTAEGERLLESYENHSRSAVEQVRHRFRNPLLTVDGVVLVEGSLVVVRRGNEPQRGRLALPGGIVEYGETVEEAVVREVREETGLETRVSRLLSIRSEPDRDPRGHFVTVAFLLEAVGGELRAGDDASCVSLVPLDPLPELAFDHSRIVLDFIGEEGVAFRPNRS